MWLGELPQSTNVARRILRESKREKIIKKTREKKNERREKLVRMC